MLITRSSRHQPDDQDHVTPGRDHQLESVRRRGFGELGIIAPTIFAEIRSRFDVLGYRATAGMNDVVLQDMHRWAYAEYDDLREACLRILDGEEQDDGCLTRCRCDRETRVDLAARITAS